MTLRPYCIRPDDDDLTKKRLINESQILGKRYTFFQLRQLNVTSENLYKWSAPIDLIERYQLYMIDSSFQNEIYYNCSSRFWFGSFCQYTMNSLDSFTKIIQERFESRTSLTASFDNADILTMTNGTCYVHFKCNRGPLSMCLDWREICNRKCDCLNNCIDEENCFQLEMNECEDDQYRCNNGMCISQEFFRDDNEVIDCMDASDEKMYRRDSQGIICLNSPDFDCDTLTCSWFDSFSCGNGACSIIHPPVLLFTRCENGRDLLYTQVIYGYDTLSEISERCWLAIICALNLGYSLHINCTRTPLVQWVCPSRFFFPSIPISFHDIRFLYEPNITDTIVPNYICYNTKLCDHFLSTIFINGSTCQYLNQFPFFDPQMSINQIFSEVEFYFKQWCQSSELITTNEQNCSHSVLFHCKGTEKCISKYRLLDRNIDCYQSYDELLNESCSWNLSHRFYCPSDKKCIPQIQIKDSIIDCSEQEDELSINSQCVLNKQCDNEMIIFSKICNGFTEISPIEIDDQNETDETNCQYWPCVTQYTKCDKVWNCYNGADELNCSYMIYPYNCSVHEHHCILVDTIQQGEIIDTHISYGCLPMQFIGDKHMNCLGSTDERDYCRQTYPDEVNRRYRCWNDTICIDINRLCDCRNDCPLEDDEAICPWLRDISTACYSDFFTCSNSKTVWRQGLCTLGKACDQKEEALICDLYEWNKPERKYFSIGKDYLRYPDLLMPNNEQPMSRTKVFRNQKSNDLLLLQWYCNQGILIYSFDQKLYCFCPPSYYGERCQYQNEFIGLVLNIRRKSVGDSLYVFRIIIVLLDDKKNLLFQEQILYISPCQKRYQMYLLYPNRPKLRNSNYSVRFDIYSIHRLDNTIHFRTSLFYPILFSFLPVNRLVLDLSISEKQVQTKLCEKIRCENGKCYQYENRNQYYCRCNHGWFGEFCHLQYECHCSSQSICTETGCICPLGKSGSLCYFPQELSCKEIICQHGGTCIPHDQRILNEDFLCICSEEYGGQFCEKRRIHMIIRFDHIPIPSSIFIHYVRSRMSRNPDGLTQFKRISVYENVVILYSLMQYDMAFAQFDNSYYLVFLNLTPAREDINTTVIQSNKCPFVEELLDQRTFLFHPLKRIKYYQLICQNNMNLVCFYDQTQICLCTQNHLTNCFDFNHNGTSLCTEHNYCENDGKCYVNDLTCPTKFICICRQCYYGTLCQFTTSGSILSLDSIIGYHIQPYVSFVKQSFIIKLGMGITIVMFVAGTISNLLSIMTFLQKKILEVGCGIYLLSSSILSVLTMIIFGYKFLSLLAIQMALITNERFLYVNCKMIDFLLRFLPTITEWLNACVAMERILNITLNVHFNKAKSIFWAKVTIIMVVVINILSAIHDPINRRLLEDTEEQRIWCIVSYTDSSWLNIYNKTLNIIHFIVPFGINFTSAFIIIVNTARQRSLARKNQSYRQHLKEQFQQHKHLLISSSVLVILALPRLIISFFSGCMKSARDPWLFFSAYLISFIPLVLTFPIFVIPSETYKNEFILAWKYYRTIIRRYFHFE
jgi:hypothetical protein